MNEPIEKNTRHSDCGNNDYNEVFSLTVISSSVWLKNRGNEHRHIQTETTGVFTTFQVFLFYFLRLNVVF